jgi:predicted nucleic acid-binding protein
LSRLVLDASVALCWLFEDQATAYTYSVLEHLAAGQEALTPVLWPFELANTLVVAERRRLLRSARGIAFLEQVAQLRIRIDPSGSERAFKEVLETARYHQLSAYDASYLDLAMREALPLATVDRALRRAARTAGVSLA